MLNAQTADTSADEKPSALQVIAGDAEKIAATFVPDVNKLPHIVGALIMQVEQLAGGRLEGLADELLAPKPPADEPADASSGITTEQAAQLQQQLAEQAETIKQLQQAQQAAAAAAPSEGAGDTKADVSGGAA